MLDFLYPEVTPEKIIDIREQKVSEAVKDLAFWKEQASFANKEKKRLEAIIRSAAEDAEVLRVHGGEVKITKTPIDGGTYERRPYVRTGLKLSVFDEGPAPWTKSDNTFAGG